MNKRFEKVPFDPARLPFFYGYVIIFLSIVGTLASMPGQTMGVSAFTDYLIRDLHTSRVNLTTAYMIGTIASSLLLTWAGKMYDRYGARAIAMTAAAGLGSVLLVLSATPFLVETLSANASPARVSLVAAIVMSIGFFLLRFFGQGLLTMTSRNMLMQWFEKRRGLANGICGVFVSFGFSFSPRVLDAMINQFSWQGTWQVLGGAIGIGFLAFVFVFFRDTPEGCGLLPDGRKADAGDQPETAEIKTGTLKEFTLPEARGTYSFWVFIVAMGLLGLYYTAFTFHIASIFEEVGRTRTEAFSVFFPASIISVAISFIAGWASDRVKLKYLLLTMLAGTLLSMGSICCLAHPWGKWGIIIGNGVSIGHFGLLSGVTWPTFFGRKHLGAISGFNMAGTVFGSAIGPWLFSVSLAGTGSYTAGSGFCIAVAVALFLCAFRADNPQEKLSPVG